MNTFFSTHLLLHFRVPTTFRKFRQMLLSTAMSLSTCSIFNFIDFPLFRCDCNCCEGSQDFICELEYLKKKPKKASRYTVKALLLLHFSVLNIKYASQANFLWVVLEKKEFKNIDYINLMEDSCDSEAEYFKLFGVIFRILSLKRKKKLGKCKIQPI